MVLGKKLHNEIYSAREALDDEAFHQQFVNHAVYSGMWIEIKDHLSQLFWTVHLSVMSGLGSEDESDL